MAVAGALSLANPGSAGAAHPVPKPVEENVVHPGPKPIGDTTPNSRGPKPIARTIAALEAQGYEVILNKVGGAPMNECVVTAIRPGNEVTEMRSNRRDRTVERVRYTTIQVDAKC
jgi:hypothetical protein